MSTILLVSILSAGFYIFILTLPNGLLFKQSSRGGLPYFIIAANGIKFTIVSLVILLYVDTENYGRILASSLSLHRKDILQWGLSYEDLKLICLAVTSILLAAISAVIIKIYHATGNRRYRLLQKLTKKDHFEKVIIDNIITNNTSPKISCVAITLRSGKVYIGWFEDVSFEQGELNDFTITPLLSGYRNKENFALVITVNYLEHFELDRRFENFPDVVFKDYKVTIMKDQVDFISLFNAATYKRFQKNTIEYNSAYLDNQ